MIARLILFLAALATLAQPLAAQEWKLDTVNSDRQWAEQADPAFKPQSTDDARFADGGTPSNTVSGVTVPFAPGSGWHVDFNKTGRQVVETQEPLFTPWMPANNWLVGEVNSISNTFAYITFTLTRIGDSGTSLTTDWWKDGITGENARARLVNDGITVANATGGVAIEMRIGGLTPGTHTLLTYHNTCANPASHTFSPLNIYVDGIPAITNLPVSNRVTNNADAAFSYLQFEAIADTDVVVMFEADISDPLLTDYNVQINGFEIDAQSQIHKGTKPVVVANYKPVAPSVGHPLAELGAADVLPVLADPQQPRLTTIPECLADVRREVGSSTPLQVTAMVTLVDPDRDLLVLQDNSGAMGVFMPPANPPLEVGQIVSLQGTSVLPYVRSFPDYPHRPSGRGFVSSLEAPAKQGSYYLARMRGYLHPPVTGHYTFWIAADDAAVLWLSPDADPRKAQRISSVRPGDSTGPREWDRHDTQASLEVDLEAGERYYIEIMQMHGTGPDHLAVAWERPGITQSVVDAIYLTPWEQGATGASSPLGLVQATNGLVREYWTNFFIRDFFALGDQSDTPARLEVQDPRITVLGSGPLPTPRRVMPRGSPAGLPGFQWAEVEGTIGFVALAGGSLQFELVDTPSRMRVTVLNWNDKAAVGLENSRVRVRGVYERVYDKERKVVGGSMRVPDARHLTIITPSESDPFDLDSVLMSQIEPSNPRMTWGSRIKVRGRVESEEVDGSILLCGDDVVEGFSSADGTNWNRMGKPVEIRIGNSALVGLTVASHHRGDQATARFDHVMGPGSNWLSASVHDSPPGGYSIDESGITLRGGGRGIAGGSDHFFFLHQPLEGEGEIKARMPSLVSRDPRAQAGLMIRESMDPKSLYAAVLFTPDQGAKFQCRKIFGDFPVDFVPQQAQRWLKVVRRKNCVRVHPAEASDLESGVEVNVVGTLIWENGSPVLAEASFAEVATEDLPSLEDHVMHRLSVEELLAKAQRPSQEYQRGYLKVAGVRGLVTFCDRVRGVNTAYIQDGASGILLRWADTNLTVSLPVGNWVEVSGHATVGQSPVTLDTDTVVVMEQGTMPEAVPYSAGDFGSRSRYGQWVEVEGVVRRFGQDGTVNLMTRGGMLAAWLGRTPVSKLNRYVDSSVRARGVVTLDAAGTPFLLIASPEFLEIRKAAPSDPISIPTFPVAVLGGLNMEPEQIRRMKVSGVVTCVQPNGLFVQDDSGGVRALTTEAGSVRLGDQVEVVGFPTGGSSLTLSEALVRRTGRGASPTPLAIRPGVSDLQQYAGLLVGLEGVVLEQRYGRERQVLSLQVGTRVFEVALVSTAAEVGRLPAIPVGSRVAVTGVCQINRGNEFQGVGEQTDDALVASFRIWLRTPTDVVLLQRPPWWTWKHFVSVVFFFLCGLLAALIWARTLRRRVTQRTRELHQATSRLEKEIHTSAVLAERDRLAGEIHDSVEQGLTAIMLQLDAAAKQAHNPEAARRCLGMARSMAGFSRAEVQHAVWDLQSPLLKNTDLGAALKHVADEISSGTSPRVTVSIVGQPSPLPSSVEHHLLRIGQEAITNAVKHAQPRTIQVILEYSEPELRLSVEDDGNGFDTEGGLKGDQMGHFGLQGIRSRSRKINSKLAVSSRPGHGTTIVVTVALNHGAGWESDGGENHL